MTSKKTTRRALFSSVMALLLCCSMLIGTTFAWFTDTVTSSGNIIKSGTLEVEMYWADGTKAVPAEGSTDWKDASTEAIFNYDLWEPGYTQVRHIKIKNVGSLALKYQLDIMANGEVSELSDVIDVYFVDPATQVANRTTLDDNYKVGTLTEILDGMPENTYGTLTAGTEANVTIALKMQETAGNDYQDKEIGTDFKVVLTATQKDYESDSFDKDYDADLLPPNEDGDILVEENGIQYVYTADGEHILYLVTEAYASDTVIVPEGVTTIGSYSFYYNDNVKNVVLSSTVRDLTGAFTESAVENVTLNESLEEISKNAFKKTYNLQSVTIPSTVKSIGETAFQQTGLKEIVIPASVESLGYQSFVSSQIEKVTIEGNVVFENRVFRGCTKLNTVTINGDTVEFVNNSSNGDCWISNKESNNPNYSHITFYVKNADVESKVRAALGAELPETTPIYVDGKITIKVTTADAFLNALKEAETGTVIDATGVTVEPTGSLATTVTIPAGITVKNATFAASSQAYLVTSGIGDPVIFENCAFDGPGFGMFVIAGNDQDGANMVFNGCSFEGQIAPNFYNNTNGKSTFTNCTFTVGSDNIGLVNCMGGSHTFTGCTFDYTGGSTMGSNQYVRWNAVNSYSENYSTKVELIGCTFINCGTQRYGSNSTLTVK